MVLLQVNHRSLSIPQKLAAEGCLTEMSDPSAVRAEEDDAAPNWDVDANVDQAYDGKQSASCAAGQRRSRDGADIAGSASGRTVELCLLTACSVRAGALRFCAGVWHCSKGSSLLSGAHAHEGLHKRVSKGTVLLVDMGLTLRQTLH